MKKIILILIFSFAVLPVKASESCGTYEFSGTIKEINEKIYLVLNPMTMSEKQFVFEEKEAKAISVFKNFRISGEIFFKIDDKKNISIYHSQNIKPAIGELYSSDRLRFKEEIKCD